MIEQIRKGNAITLTDPGMTRFIMSLDDAVSLVLLHLNTEKEEIFWCRKLRLVRLGFRQRQCAICLAAKEDIKIIGIRHGEKMYETLLTNEECAHAIDMGISTEFRVTSVA